MALGKSISEVNQMSAWEIKEWEAYERVTGQFGQERNDQLAAMLAKTIVNLFRSKGSKTAVTTDFIPKWGFEEVNGDGREHP